LQQPSTQLPQAFDTLSCTVPKVNLADVNLGEEIGRGGFGIVYKGLWIGTKVAIKEIRIKRIKVAKPLVDRELCVHSQLRHPNIVMLMAFALEKDRLYLISELIDGLTLDNCLFGNDAMCMNMSVKLNVSLMVSQAIAYLHAQNPMIIHRDIKPENILVANNFGVVKLCDMGISKLKTMNTVTTTMAGVCLQPGTPAYQAPEILLNRQSANEMTDIWSLACTLVEIFNELPVWNTSDEPVMYIMNKMKLQAKPDGLEVLAALADTYNENVESKIYNLLNKGLSYNDCERPRAIQIVNCFHGFVGVR
jgi:E3 ubiquitin-protein ligase mind-bomb